MKFIVAIDGPAAAGKGTIARAVAARFGFAHLDTGMLYRAVGKKAMDLGHGVLDEGVAVLVATELSPADLEADGLAAAPTGFPRPGFAAARGHTASRWVEKTARKRPK